MTTALPDAVLQLIAALEWRAERLGKATRIRSLAEERAELPQLLLLDGPSGGVTTYGQMTGYYSLTDFLANSWPNNKCIPWRITCLVTIGDGRRPTFIPFDIQRHAFDVLSTAATLLAYYEGREKLPAGLTKEVTSWLMDKTDRIGYGDDDSERAADQAGHEAVRIFRQAVLSVCEVHESPLLMQMFGDNNFSYSSQYEAITGQPTRLFCRTFANPDDQNFNQLLADLFEWKARETLTWFFTRQVAYKYGIDSEKTTYQTLPRSKWVGAFAHLPLSPELPPAGPAALEE